MDISSTETILSSASSLIHDIATGLLDQDAGGFGSFTPAVYDTAWLAMVVKPNVEQHQALLFPECLNYLIREQRDDGSWESYGSQIDGILNSLAALLALVKHEQGSLCSPAERSLLSPRIEKAKSAVLNLLKNWDVKDTNHVGFEILVPSLLEGLALYDIKLYDFPEKELLYRLYERKLKKFPFEVLYGKTQTTLLHSLEAFVGKLDFGRLSHHLTAGSMLGSPASTAAYLMEATEWDTRAENYLHQVEQRWFGGGKQMGIPSAFPCTVFESSWAISTLLANGFDRQCLPQEDVQLIVEFLSETLKNQNGTVGFAPGFLADADDTAVSLLVLRQFDIEVSFKGLLDTFSATKNFRTYAQESSPSFSANCNVLIALLSARFPEEHSSHIKTAIEYLVNLAEEGPLKDKWNVATTYSCMLLIRALVTATRAWDGGRLQLLTEMMEGNRLSGIICHIVSRIMSEQSKDGSWGASVDQTAYGILALAHAMKLPWPESMTATLKESLDLGRDFLLQLNSEDLQTPSYVWIEKVTYASPILSRVYALAAMQSPASPLSWTQKTRAMFDLDIDHLSPMVRLVSKTPLFAEGLPPFKSVMVEESALYLRRLVNEPVCSSIFPTREKVLNRYKTIIPLTWVSCNYRLGFPLGPKQMWFMMVLSDLIYQSDEYMESTVRLMTHDDQNSLEAFIREQCGCQDMWLRSSFPHHGVLTTQKLNGAGETPPSSSESIDHLEDSKEVLRAFIAYVLQQPLLLSRPNWQKQVAVELCGFLVAHIRHVRDNNQFSSQLMLKERVSNGNGVTIDTFHNPRITYFEWINTVATDDTSCPFAFTIFLALMADEEPLQTPYARYVAQTLCMHLGRMCRQYNDYGSLSRDQEEMNLNSLNFPEFSGLRPKESKQQLMLMAEFEREGVIRTMSSLKSLVKGDVWEQLKAFVDVTDLYGQIYVLKDLTNRTT